VVAPGGCLVVTVHHYSRLKQRQGWIKEGKPGQPGIDYIFRFSHADMRALLPGAEIQAMGYRTRGERLFTPFMRRMAAKQGRGHMLLAITHP
jgi:hypothetical protein